MENKDIEITVTQRIDKKYVILIKGIEEKDLADAKKAVNGLFAKKEKTSKFSEKQKSLI